MTVVQVPREPMGTNPWDLASRYLVVLYLLHLMNPFASATAYNAMIDAMVRTDA